MLSQRPPERPPFELALAFWRDRLAGLALAAPMQWVFRESLTLGHDGDREDDAALCFQRFAPRFDERYAREVYEVAADWEPQLRLTPLVAAPDELIVTLCTESHQELLSVHRADWGLDFDLEPTFHTFTEIDSRAEWARATRRDDDGALSELTGVLHGRVTAGV